MMAGLGRLLIPVLLGALVGLGVIAALFRGARPGRRLVAPGPRPDPVAAPHRTPGARRGPALALLGLVLAAGLIAALSGSGGALLRSPPRPGDGGLAPLAAPSSPAETGSSAPPGGGRTPEPGVRAQTGLATPADARGTGRDPVRVAPGAGAVVADRAAPKGTPEAPVDGKPAPGADGPSPRALPTGRSETDAGSHMSRPPFSVAVPPAPDDGPADPATREDPVRAAGQRDTPRQPASGLADAPRGQSADPDDPPQASSTGALAATGAAKPPAGAPAVHVPRIDTARVAQGDSLWSISRRTHGAGGRYKVIYAANQDQIRDPDLIYPGQTVVLPSEAHAGSAGYGRRR